MDEAPQVNSSHDGLSELEGAAWSGLLYVQASVIRQLDAELKTQANMAVSTWEVLFFLSRAPDYKIRLSALAQATLLTLSGISHLIDRLEREQLVRREIYPNDRRGAYAILTEAGLARLEVANRVHFAGVRQHFLNHFSNEELATMVAFWHRLIPDWNETPIDGLFRASQSRSSSESDPATEK